jgi:hypothetical protein
MHASSSAKPATAETVNGLERWLGEFDALFLRRNNADPLVLVPWRMWARIVEQVRR